MLFPLYWMVNVSLTQPERAAQGPAEPVPAPSRPSTATRGRAQRAAALPAARACSSDWAPSSLTVALSAPAAFALAKLRPRGGRTVNFILLDRADDPRHHHGDGVLPDLQQLGRARHHSGPDPRRLDARRAVRRADLHRVHDRHPRRAAPGRTVDGADRWRTFRSIVMPISRNSVVTVALFAFLWAWSDFIFASTLNRGGALQPITMGIYRYIGNNTQDWNAIMATAVVASIPAAVLLVIAQRYVAAGVTAGARQGLTNPHPPTPREHHVTEVNASTLRRVRDPVQHAGLVARHVAGRRAAHRYATTPPRLPPERDARGAAPASPSATARRRDRSGGDAARCCAGGGPARHRGGVRRRGRRAAARRRPGAADRRRGREADPLHRAPTSSPTRSTARRVHLLRDRAGGTGSRPCAASCRRGVGRRWARPPGRWSSRRRRRLGGRDRGVRDRAAPVSRVERPSTTSSEVARASSRPSLDAVAPWRDGRDAGGRPRGLRAVVGDGVARGLPAARVGADVEALDGQGLELGPLLQRAGPRARAIRTLASTSSSPRSTTRTPSGALPDSVTHSEVLYNFVKPPIHGWALRQLRERADAAIASSALVEIHRAARRVDRLLARLPPGRPGTRCRTTSTATTAAGTTRRPSTTTASSSRPTSPAFLVVQLGRADRTRRRAGPGGRAAVGRQRDGCSRAPCSTSCGTATVRRPLGDCRADPAAAACSTCCPSWPAHACRRGDRAPRRARSNGT